MISVVIAEDEHLELNALENFVDYASLGMQISGKAYDGETALSLIVQLQPDILITDIVMPKASGLSLIRQAKEINPDICIIITSGHQQFDYAQQAIKYGVDHYLLKPILPEHLYEALSNISLKIQQRNHLRFEKIFFSQELEKNLPLLRESFVRSLIDGNIPLNTIDERMSYYRIKLENKPLIVICILSEDQSDFALLSLRHCITNYFTTEDINYCFTSLSSSIPTTINVICQWNLSDSTQVIFDFTERLRISILADFGLSVTIGVSYVGCGYAAIPSCASIAQQAVDYRFYLGIGQVITSQDISIPEQVDSFESLRRLFPPILSILQNGDKASIDILCNQLQQEATKCAIPPAHLRILFMELTSRIIITHCNSGQSLPENSHLSTLYTELFSAKTLEDMISIIHRELLSAIESIDKGINGRELWLVSKIKKIIKDQYTENLTIDSISKQIYISSGYAARLFRKHTGDSINNYIINVRMSMAAEILKDPSISIKNAALQVGYSNTAYFSSVFRKKYGYTPREWRDKHSRT